MSASRARRGGSRPLTSADMPWIVMEMWRGDYMAEKNERGEEVRQDDKAREAARRTWCKWRSESAIAQDKQREETS